MVTKHGEVVTHYEELPLFKHVFMWDYVTNFKNISTNTMSMGTTRLVKVMNNREGLPLINSNDPLILWSYEITWKIKNIYLHFNKAIKSHDNLNKWLCEVTWEIKHIKSQLTQCLGSTNLSGWWNTTRSSHP